MELRTMHDEQGALEYGSRGNNVGQEDYQQVYPLLNGRRHSTAATENGQVLNGSQPHNHNHHQPTEEQLSDRETDATASAMATTPLHTAIDAQTSSGNLQSPGSVTNNTAQRSRLRRMGEVKFLKKLVNFCGTDENDDLEKKKPNFYILCKCEN